MQHTIALAHMLSMMALVGIAHAHTRDHVERTADGKVRISTRTTTPTLCHYAGQPFIGRPPGVAPFRNSIALTHPVRYRGNGVCAAMVSDVSFTLEVDVPEGSEMIMRYIWNERSGVVDARALDIPE